MNFFGNVGPLNSVKTNPKNSLATQKKWHSTKNLHEEASSKPSLASQTRRKNRTNNLDSLWYDYKDTAEGEGYTLRKSSSLDNLLSKSSKNNKSRIPLTKDMISSPQYLGKIVRVWGGRTTSKMFDNSFSIAEIEEETIEKDESEITEFELDPGSEAMQLDEASDISMVETVVSVDTAIIEESIGPDEPPDSFQAIKEDKSHVQLHYSSSSTSEEDNNPTTDIDLPDGTYGTVDETAFEADTDSKPVIFNNDSDDTNSEVLCSSLKNRSVHLSGSENASVICEMSEEKLVENEEAIVESAPPSPGMTMTVEEFLRMPVPNNERLEKHDKDGCLEMLLKVSSSKNFWGTRTVDRFKRKNINNIDISGPRYLRRWSGTQGSSSNLLGMKNLSKSTDVHLLSSAHSGQYFGDEQEVLRTLQSNKDDPISQNVVPFPRNDDGLYFTEDIQIRHNAVGNRGFRQSKTIDFEIHRKSPTKIHDFEVTGCVKIQLPNVHSLLKLKKNEHIRYQNNVIYKVDDSLTQSLPLKIGVSFKSARVLNKKGVELRDTFNQAYLLIFDSSKDAKNFTETDNVACLFDTEESTIDKILLSSMGKESNRDRGGFRHLLSGGRKDKESLLMLKLRSPSVTPAARIQRIEELVNARQRYTKDIDEKIQELMRSLRSGIQISELERVEIVTALGLKQGHWFKCPNGHPYVITECGGAMQEYTCPEAGCGEKIGGTRHTLIGTNQLASEMDGARFAAYSNMANDFRNYYM